MTNRDCGSTTAAAVRDAMMLAEAMGDCVPMHQPPAELRARVLRHAGERDDIPQAYVAYVHTAAFARRLAIAAMIVAAVMAIIAWQYREEAARARADRQVVQSRLTGLEQQLAQLRTAAATATQTRTVLAAQDLARVELAGQTAAPGATGRVFSALSELTIRRSAARSAVLHSTLQTSHACIPKPPLRNSWSFDPSFDLVLKVVR